MKISCIIPARDKTDLLLIDLLRSIDIQNYPKELVEVLVVTEGDSEQAKAIGVRQATGDILCMLCADNLILDQDLFEGIRELFTTYPGLVGVYSKHYHYRKKDNSLNRYFALIGANDPIPFYLGKADRLPHWNQNSTELMTFLEFQDSIPSLGDNGFFLRAKWFKTSNLDHYYPMDCCEDLRKAGLNTYIRVNNDYLWHRTAENLISFMRKRYRYARDLYCDRQDRRWKMLDSKEDYWRLCFFVFATLTFVNPFLISLRGYCRIKDWAWFWHWPVALGTIITYGLLACRNLLRHRSLFQHSADLKVSKPA